MNAKLDAAVQVYRDLGWHSNGDVLTLPLGTPEQQKVAVAGLRSGTWRSSGPDRFGRWRDVSLVGDVDRVRLAVFALRVGVPAPRCATILLSVLGWNEDVPPAQVVAAARERGSAFAAALVTALSRPGARFQEDALPTQYAAATLPLVDGLDLPIPDNRDYLLDWVLLYSHALGPQSATAPVPVAVLARRELEHVRLAAAHHLPPLGLVEVITHLVRSGVLDRTEAVDTTIGLLDAATRPGERKDWLRLLTETLAITTDEVVARADMLVPALATGEGLVVEAFGVPLAEHGGDELLPDLLTVTAAAKTAKATKAMFTALGRRSKPGPEVAADCAPLLADLAGSAGRNADLAARLAEAWGERVEPTGPEPVEWVPTPEVWSVPRFEVDGDLDRLVDLARDWARRDSRCLDIEDEEFFALLVHHLHADADATRAVLPAGVVDELLGLGADPDRMGWSMRELLDYPATHLRTREICLRGSTMPVLLSTPTWVDMRIDPADLVARLALYRERRVAVGLGDLHLALTRLDLTLLTDEARRELGGSTVGVALERGIPQGLAGPALATFLRHGLVEPEVRRTELGASLAPVRQPGLKPLGDRLQAGASMDLVGVVPAWGDLCLLALDSWPRTDAARMWAQAARRGVPFGPEAAIDLIGTLRDADDGEPVHRRAVVDAWDRGLLRPEAIDFQLLSGGDIDRVGTLVVLLRDLVHEGLLALVWPLLDQIAAWAAPQSRVPTGTAEAMQLARELAPSVLAATGAGTAPTEALEVPGIRAMAARSGSSAAVKDARAAIEGFPTVATPAAVAAAEAAPAVPFEECWVSRADPQAVDDDVTVRWSEAGRFPRVLLTIDGGHYVAPVVGPLRGTPAAVNRILQVLPVAGEDDTGPEWLSPGDERAYWDKGAERVQVRTQGRLRKVRPGKPLPAFLCAVTLLQVMDDPERLRELVEKGMLGARRVCMGMTRLYVAGLSPRPWLAMLDRDPTLISALWPVLTEGVRHLAAAGSTQPTWAGPLMSMVVTHAETLREAGRRGLVPADDAALPGLSDLATRKGVVGQRARTLLEA